MTTVTNNTPKESLGFASLELREQLQNNIPLLGYSSMTPIQQQSLPIMLQGTDVIARAQTGSGKTAAFGLSILNNLQIDNHAVQTLVLCPTRELAEQVAQTLRQLARLMPNVKILNLSGGIQMRIQLDSLKHSPHIIVGTPGRVQKHLDKETISLKSLQTLVLDEADRMLDMGFYDEIKDIIKQCPQRRQTLLFSATYPAEIKKLATDFMHNPVIVMVEQEHAPLDIEQIYYHVNNYSSKYPLLKSILLHFKPSSTIIFCNTKDQTTKLTQQLDSDGFSAVALNGDMEQFERDEAMIRFKNQSCAILVATDVAARGLDIKELPAVVNYELAFDHDVHTHRIGRTGRAGNKGLAISIVTRADDERVVIIEENLPEPIIWGNRGDLDDSDQNIAYSGLATIRLNIGRKNKIRPGDIMGALSKDAAIPADAIGKIDITPLYSYVAVQLNQVSKVLQYLKTGKVKNLKVHAKRI